MHEPPGALVSLSAARADIWRPNCLCWTIEPLSHA